MALTDSQIRNALPADSRYRLTDGAHGLYVCVHPHGGKYFVFRFTWRGKDAELALGTYPKRTLKEARKAAADAEQLVAEGIDPREERRAAKAIKRPTFREVAEEWFATRTKPSGKDPTRQRPPLAPKTISKMRWILDDHLYPSAGPGLPALAELYLDEIRSPQLLATLRAIEQKGLHETAHRSLTYARQIFDFGDACGFLPGKNPTAPLGRVLAPVSVTHHASIYSPEGLGELMLAIEGYAGEEITAIALDVMPRTITRSKELRFAEWSEIRWREAEWYIPRERMKMRLPHIVPLSPEVLNQLKRLHALTGHQRYLFPSIQTPDSVMSENTLGKALRIMGYPQGTMTAHGFRTAASTRLNESARWRPDAIERQLAHCEQDSVRAVYNYAQYLPERRKMMVWWSKHLDELRERARVRRRVGPSEGMANTQHRLSPDVPTSAAA